ncbi:hypothetical protein D3C71_1447260 [compost metagenome]
MPRSLAPPDLFHRGSLQVIHRPIHDPRHLSTAIRCGQQGISAALCLGHHHIPGCKTQWNLLHTLKLRALDAKYIQAGRCFDRCHQEVIRQPYGRIRVISHGETVQLRGLSAINAVQHHHAVFMLDRREQTTIGATSHLATPRHRHRDGNLLRHRSTLSPSNPIHRLLHRMHLAGPHQQSNRKRHCARRQKSKLHNHSHNP